MSSYKKIASKQDKRVAKAGGFKIRPNSGAIAGHKGDLGGAELFIETKTRVEVKEHLGIDLRWLDKAKAQAFSMGKPIAILVISPGDTQDYVIFEYRMAEQQMSTLTENPVDLPLSGRGQYLKVPLSTLDRFLYRGRKLSVYPVVRLQRVDLDLGVMYLEDFITYWNNRENEPKIHN